MVEYILNFLQLFFSFKVLIVDRKQLSSLFKNDLIAIKNFQ